VSNLVRKDDETLLTGGDRKFGYAITDSREELS
jgi:hypothetical protein